MRVYLRHRTTATFRSEKLQSLGHRSATVVHAALFMIVDLTLLEKSNDEEAAPFFTAMSG
jgi:hypothetical protein